MFVVLGRTAGLKIGKRKSQEDLRDVHFVDSVPPIAERRNLAVFEVLPPDKQPQGCMWLLTYDATFKTHAAYTFLKEDLAVRHLCARIDNSTYLCVADPSLTMELYMLRYGGKWWRGCVAPHNDVAKRLAAEAAAEAAKVAASVMLRQAHIARAAGRRKAVDMIYYAESLVESGALKALASLAGEGAAKEYLDALNSLRQALGLPPSQQASGQAPSSPPQASQGPR